MNDDKKLIDYLPPKYKLFLTELYQEVQEGGMYANCQDDTNWYKAQLEILNKIIKA